MDKEIYIELVKQALKHECRLSDRQIRLVEWQHIGECSVKTRTGREAKISKITYAALLALPHDHPKYVFGASAHMGYKPTLRERIHAKKMQKYRILLGSV